MRKHYSCLDFVNNGGLVTARESAFAAALFAVFEARARGHEAPARARRLLELELSRCLRNPSLTYRKGRYVLTWGVASPVAEAVHSALALLTSEDLERVRVCAGDDCNWLFIDESRNNSRRWCDMKVCGNRAKAKRFYARWS